jgi:hypothetical protein
VHSSPAHPTAHRSGGRGTQTVAARPPAPRAAGHPWTAETGSGSWCAQRLQDELMSVFLWGPLRPPQQATCQGCLTPLKSWETRPRAPGLAPTLSPLPEVLSSLQMVTFLGVSKAHRPAPLSGSRSTSYHPISCPCLCPRPPLSHAQGPSRAPEIHCLPRKVHQGKPTRRTTVSLELDLTLWKQLKNA